jgi:photosystem II stability/assembly factor-like uncharacterized protein
MNSKYFLLSLLLAILTITSQYYTQQVNIPNDSLDIKKEKKPNYRRTDPNNLPPPEKYTQPKQEVFPLGYLTRTLGKVATGTGVWTELNPKVPRVTYLGLHFVNKDTGWACGQSGAVIKTIDGGSSWTISNTPVNNLLLKTHSYNGQIVLVTGYDGIILRSSDGGDNFVQVTSGVGGGYDLWGVQMLNDTLGWVCGLYQTLLKTTDGALSWQPVNIGINQHYWSLNFLNENYGMMTCSSGIILKTTDGGNSWTQTQAGDTRDLFTIDVIDSLHIAAAGYYGKNVYCSDGGTTWISNPDLPAFSATNCIDFINADTGYSVQDVYDIQKTTNRGQSWFNPAPNVTSEWYIQLLNDGTGYSSGEEPGGGYALNFFKRTNGLENWSRLFLNYNWNDVFFINEMKGYIIGNLSIEYVLYKTENGGLSYQKVENAPEGYDIVFTDSLAGFIVSDNSVINKTTDAGTNWYLTNVPNPVGDFREIFFINHTTGWASTIWTPTSNANILKTTDRGENWFVQVQQSGVDGFTSIFFIDTLHGWATSRYIWQTTNGGQNWIERTDIPIFLPDDVYFTNSDTGWVGRYSIINNSLFKTTDGGLNWVGIPEVIGARKLFFFPDPIHWLTLGFSRYYWTNDYGNSWHEFTEDVPSGVISFFAPSNYLGYSVGKGGLILRYDDTTYVPVELISFEWKVGNNEVILLWETATEINNQGFYIEKSFNKLNWETIGFVEGKGTTTETNSYNFVDRKITDLKMYYRLKQVDYDGSFTYSKIVEVKSPINDFSISQNFPNPANPSTTISFSIPVKTKVQINLYSISGELVKIILSEEKEKGIYSVKVDLSELATGVYFYRMTTSNGYNNVRKLILLK